MQKFVSKYALAAHLALLAVAPLVLYPFLGAEDSGVVVLWLTLSAALWILLEPSRRSDEMLNDARLRTAYGIVRDPVFWVFVLLSALAAARWANSGVSAAYDAASGKWALSKPAAPFLPSAAAGRGFLEFASTLSLAVAVAGCRHALGRSARLSFLLCSSLFAACGAVAAIVCAWAGVPGIVRNMALDFPPQPFCGGAYGVWMLSGIVALAGGLESRWNKLLLLFSFAIGGCAAGVFYFAPPTASLLWGGLAVVFVAACGTRLFFVSAPIDAMRFAAGIFIASAAPVAVAVALAPEDATAAKTACFASWNLFPDGFWALRQRLSEIAVAVWRNHVWTGSGLGTFPLEARFAATAADWDLWGPSAPFCALHGWRHFLAENGIAGVAAFAAPFAFISFTWLRRALRCDYRRAFLPLCALGPAAVAAAAAATFADISLFDPAFRPAVLCVFALSACALAPARTAPPDDASQKDPSLNGGR